MIVVNPQRPVFQFTDIELEILHSALVNYDGPYPEGSKLNEFEVKSAENMIRLSDELSNSFHGVLTEIHYGGKK